MLDIYSSMINKMIAEDSSAILENNSPGHTNVILKALIKSAEHEIYALCTSFPKEIATDVKDALSRGVKVYLALRTVNFELEDFLKYKRTNEDAYKNDFWVIDNKRYWVKRNGPSAFVSMNNTEIANRLVSWFNLSID